MAPVKRLEAIDLIERPVGGCFGREMYICENGGSVPDPVRHRRVRTLMTEPVADEERAPGAVTIKGVAWPGEAPIAKIEVNVNGARRREESLAGEPNRRCWPWREPIGRIGRPRAATLGARATDQAARVQPEQAARNQRSYGNNAIHEMEVHVR